MAVVLPQEDFWSPLGAQSTLVREALRSAAISFNTRPF